MTQHRQYSQPKSKHQESTKRSGAGADGLDRAEPTTTRGGRRTAVRPARTAVRACVAAGFCRFRVALRLPAVFATFCLYNAHVPRPNEHLIHLIAYFHASPFSFLVLD